MGFSDTRIHQIELLLTLDYLLRFTDEDHPATRENICRHATDFGLKYDAKAKSGNDVRRQRISDCLKFLMDVTTKFPEEVPFVLETTPSGKYYIDQKNYLSEEQIIKILAAVQNDKYTQDEDTEFLIERLLDSLSNVYNRDHYKNELNKLKKGVKKYNFATNRKIRLVNKAFNDGKMLKIRWQIRDKNKVDIHVYDFWYRVYKIKEYRNKPYAILIPIYTGDIIFFKGFIFDTIENLNIPKGPDKDVLCDDFDEKRDLDKLFREIQIFREYGFKAVVHDTGDIEENISQSDTDIKFLTQLANDQYENFIVYVEGTTGYFIKKPNLGNPQATLQYREGNGDLLSFSPRINKQTKQLKVDSAEVNTKDNAVDKATTNDTVSRPTSGETIKPSNTTNNSSSSSSGGSWVYQNGTWVQK